MADKIFQDDPRFDDNLKKNQSGDISKGFSNLGTGVKSLFTGFFQIFTKRIPMNLFFLLLLIAAAFFGAKFLDKPEITGNVVAENIGQNISCPEYICPDCECPEPKCEFNESLCPKKDEKVGIYYKCPSGNIVNNSDECGKYPINLTSETHTIAENAILSLDWVNFTVLGNDTYTINRMNVTVANLDTTPILPEIHIKLYERFSSSIEEEYPLRKIEFDDVLKFNGVISKSEPMILTFEELPKTIRLELYDTLPDPDKRLAIVTKEVSSLTLS